MLLKSRRKYNGTLSIEKELKIILTWKRNCFRKTPDGKHALLHISLWEEVKTAVTVFLWKTGRE
jgi:hypothetical protein